MELKFLRHAARLTQQQLADRAHVDNSTISLVESGKRDLKNVSYDAVCRLARALNVPPHALVPDIEPPASDAEAPLEESRPA